MNPLEFNLTLAALDFNTAPLEVRERFSISPSNVNNLLVSAADKNIESALIVSTCNRTEVYAQNCTESELIDLFISQTLGNKEEFEKYGFTLKNNEALDHLFRVGCGLESQIVGDAQILGQIKAFASKSQKIKMLSPEFDRAIQFVIRAAKKVKSDTEINKGSSSVSYAGVHYIKENVKDFQSKNILLFGTGKIGSVTCDNLLKHVHHEKLTLINRTEEKAEKLAKKFEVSYQSIDSLSENCDDSQIIVVATGNDRPTLSRAHLKDDYSENPKVILDLSVPRNVEKEVAEIPGITVMDIDELSIMVNTTIQAREASVPHAESIIQLHKSEYLDWLEERIKYIPFLKIFKSELKKLATEEIDQLKSHPNNNGDMDQLETITNKVIDKVAFKLMDHLKKDDKHESIEQLTHVLKTVSQ